MCDHTTTHSSSYTASPPSGLSSGGGNSRTTTSFNGLVPSHPPIKNSEVPTRVIVWPYKRSGSGPQMSGRTIPWNQCLNTISFCWILQLRRLHLCYPYPYCSSLFCLTPVQPPNMTICRPIMHVRCCILFSGNSPTTRGRDQTMVSVSNSRTSCKYSDPFFATVLYPANTRIRPSGKSSMV